VLVVVLLLTSCTGSDGAGPGTSPATTSQATTSPVATDPATTTPVTTTPPTTTPETTGPIPGSDCPVVVAAELAESSPGVFRVSATVRSVDIEDVSYADAWEVRDMEGNVLGTRVLTHPHGNEQPFTRSLSGVEIPDEVTEVVVDARDSVRGFCGTSLTVAVPRS
jgi:hypothetical protein